MRARVLCGLLLLVALASPVFAAGRQVPGAPSLDRILPEIRRHTPGTFYDAQGPFVGPDGLARYRIKWMTPNGRIVWFDADARTGRVLGPAPGGLPGNLFGGNRFGNGPGGFPPGQFGNPGWPPPDYNGGRQGGGRDGKGGRDRNGGNWGPGRGDHGRGDGGRGDRGGE